VFHQAVRQVTSLRARNFQTLRAPLRAELEPISAYDTANTFRQPIAYDRHLPGIAANTSGLGQERSSQFRVAMSAPPSEADMYEQYLDGQQGSNSGLDSVCLALADRCLTPGR
jgi:hypothetical protein